MAFVFRTCALFLALPLKVTCDTTLGPHSTRQHEDTFKENEITRRDDNSTSFTAKYNDRPLDPNNETTFNPSSTWLQNVTASDNETHARAEMGDESTTRERKKYVSLETLPQTSVSDANYVISYAMRSSTRENRSPSNLSPPPLSTEPTQKKTTPPQTRDVAITTRNKQTFYHKFTNKGLAGHTNGNRTTRSTEQESFRTSSQQTDEHDPSHFQNSGFTNQSGVEVQTTEILTTEWSSLPQENQSTHPPTLNITDSKTTLDISNEERTHTLLNTPTTTGFSTGLGRTVHTTAATSGTKVTVDKNATHETTTKETISEINTYNPNRETGPMTPTDNTKSSKKPAVNENQKNKNKAHPGTVVACLIGSILLFMFVAFLVILVRNHQTKKRKMENTDWAGPSPFIDRDVQPAVNEERPFYRQESKKISLHSFLPQRLSRLGPTDEEVPSEDIQVGGTSGQENGKATPEPIEPHEANSSPTDFSTDPSVPETLSLAPTQPAPKSHKEIILSPPAEANGVTPTTLEDVDLNAPLDKNTECTSDAINIPSPPPLPPS